MAGSDSFINVTLRDGTTHKLVAGDADPASIVELAAKGQRWAGDSGWIEVEGGGAVARRLVSAGEVTRIELFQR